MNSKVPRYAMRLLRNNSPISSSSSSSSSSSIISARATASTRAICSAQLSIHPLPSDALHSSRKQLPPKETLKFGKTFAPHMLQVHFNKDMGGWQSPTILPFQELKLSPASAALHYGKCDVVGSKSNPGAPPNDDDTGLLTHHVFNRFLHH